MYSDWIVTTQPAAEPVSLAEMKLHLKVESSVTADDTLIETLIMAAREWCEQYQNRSYIEQTIILKMDCFENVIKLPAPPLIGIAADGIKYLDSNGAEQTLSPTIYDVFSTCEPAEIRLAYNQTWPTTYSVKHAVRITYTAGYELTSTGSGTAITAISKANPCAITAVGHGFATGDAVHISTIIDDGPDGDIEAALNDKVFVVTYSTADIFTVPVNTTAFVNSWASGGLTKGITTLVPSRVKAAIKLLVGHLYEHREAAIADALKEIPLGIKHLLSIDRNF